MASLLGSSNALASDVPSQDFRGYMMKLEDTVAFFAGLSSDDRDIQIPVSTKYFSEAQFETMRSCQEKKATHATQVSVQSENPDSPNFLNSKVVTVSCVEAPGFYAEWSEVFLRSGDL